MTGHYGICHEKGKDAEAFAFATALRRMGHATDYILSGKVERQIAKAQRGGAGTIITFLRDGRCALDRSFVPRVYGEVEDMMTYVKWLEDETETLAEPPDHFFISDLYESAAA